MNPKLTIAVGENGKLSMTYSGLVTVGAKVDVEVRGLNAADIPDWAEGDDYTGKSLRFRIVDAMGSDLVRFPLVKKDTAAGTDGDKWTVTGNVFTAVADFNTKELRAQFCGLPSCAKSNFGALLDSPVDEALYGAGKVSIRNWAVAPTEDPKTLPNMRDALEKLNADIQTVEAAKNTAVAAASHYPKVGQNGNWYVWNPETGDWADSGVRAETVDISGKVDKTALGRLGDDPTYAEVIAKVNATVDAIAPTAN